MNNLPKVVKGQRPGVESNQLQFPGGGSHFDIYSSDISINGCNDLSIGYVLCSCCRL